MRKSEREKRQRDRGGHSRTAACVKKKITDY